MTNCNHKHGLILTCGYDVDMFTLSRIVLSSPKRAHVDWNWPVSWGKWLKIDWSVDLLWELLVMGSCLDMFCTEVNNFIVNNN